VSMKTQVLNDETTIYVGMHPKENRRGSAWMERRGGRLIQTRTGDAGDPLVSNQRKIN
jgi:hypothetical protein